MKSFGEIIKTCREEKNLLLREASALLKIDQALISKYERGDRKASREQVILFAKIYQLNENELIKSWISDKLVYEIKEETSPIEILKLAESKVKYLKNKK